MELWSISDVWPRHGSQSTGRQENTQLVEPYERTYNWHITMERVCHHINSQNTARKSNYNNHCNTPQYFLTTTHRTQKRKTGELTVRRGVCMKSDNQRKGLVKETKWEEPKYIFSPQKHRAGSMDQSEPR